MPGSLEAWSKPTNAAFKSPLSSVTASTVCYRGAVVGGLPVYSLLRGRGMRDRLGETSAMETVRLTMDSAVIA